MALAFHASFLQLLLGMAAPTNSPYILYFVTFVAIFAIFMYRPRRETRLSHIGSRGVRPNRRDDVLAVLDKAAVHLKIHLVVFLYRFITGLLVAFFCILKLAVPDQTSTSAGLICMIIRPCDVIWYYLTFLALSDNQVRNPPTDTESSESETTTAVADENSSGNTATPNLIATIDLPRRRAVSFAVDPVIVRCTRPRSYPQPRRSPTAPLTYIAFPTTGDTWPTVSPPIVTAPVRPRPRTMSFSKGGMSYEESLMARLMARNASGTFVLATTRDEI
ncbi:hypothetical protein SISSUDRAFT_539608 [Sistotremastrum suecicum HHB10207 ss-3]|uniref:Uncharacterized protein n=1 Tax=Sistotremastrum suecicum HHB10207 ss-3 TaxID=1314776 RepID=A0A166F0V7_9AGAM|nr:hypothetical protein SISSUDRAFT_539608 [Sistotremastrum suecicum HHB10207 ss-3]